MTFQDDLKRTTRRVFQSVPLRRSRRAFAGARRRLLNLGSRAQRSLRRLLPGEPTMALHALAPWDAPQQRQANLQLYVSESNPERARLAQQPHPRAAAKTAQAGLSVCILNLDKPELIVPLVHYLQDVEAPLFAKAGLAFEIAIGDTGSRDRRVLQLYKGRNAHVRVHRGLRYQFSACNNVLGHGDAGCETLLFLNNDLIFSEAPGALWRLYQQLHTSPELGVVGACLFFPDGLVQHMGIDFLREPAVSGLCFHPHARESLDAQAEGTAWSVPAVTGACLMIKRSVYLAAGGMDEAYGAECQDVALCLTAARLGWHTQVMHVGHVVHLENATRPKGEENWPDRQRFLRQWGAYIEAKYL